MSAMSIYYVYQLVDPRNQKPFYIGQGKKQRAYSHLNFTSGCNNPHKDRIIRKIRKCEMEVVVEFIATGLTKQQAVQLEEDTIQAIGIQNLSNICDGANPPILTGKSNGFFQKQHSAENKKKMGDANRGKDLKTKQGKENIRQSLIARWKDPELRQNQIDALKKRKGEKRSAAAIEAYKKSAAERDLRMTPEQRSQRTLAGVATKKVKYAGLRRKSYFDETGRKRFKWIPAND
jgi:hypothetical protein